MTDFRELALRLWNKVLPVRVGDIDDLEDREVEIVRLAYLAGQRAADAALRSELLNIANARPSTWDDPTDFQAWAQSRARFTLAATEPK